MDVLYVTNKGAHVNTAETFHVCIYIQTRKIK
jgi:hypothetical protein